MLMVKVLYWLQVVRCYLVFFVFELAPADFAWPIGISALLVFFSAFFMKWPVERFNGLPILDVPEYTKLGPL